MHTRFWWIVGAASLVFVTSIFMQKTYISETESKTDTATITILPTTVLSPTQAPQHTTTPIPKKTVSSSTITMATRNEIFIAINTYRNAHGLSSVRSDNMLCSIAQTRANQQSASGRLTHDGFESVSHSQKIFLHVAEVLQWFSEPQTAHYLVNIGWDGSASHKATILDGSWTHGCAGVSGLYSVFVFARA